MKKLENKLLCGIALILFGCLFLLKELHFISSHNILLDPKMYPVYIAAIFLYGRELKIAGLFGVVSIILWFPTIADWVGEISNVIWPLLLIVLGVFLVAKVKRNNEMEEGETKEKYSHLSVTIERLPNTTDETEENDKDDDPSLTDEDKYGSNPTN